MSKKWKTALAVTGVALGATFIVMKKIADKQNAESVYANEPEKQKPFRGKK